MGPRRRRTTPRAALVIAARVPATERRVLEEPCNDFEELVVDLAMGSAVLATVC